MTDQVDPAVIADIHERTASLPEFERFAERIRLLYALPRPYFTNVKPLTEAQARSLAFATLPLDLEIYWEVLWAIPNRAFQACKAANEVQPLGWLRTLCDIADWARVDCIDTTEWIDERHDPPPRIGLVRNRAWLKEPWLQEKMPSRTKKGNS